MSSGQRRRVPAEFPRMKDRAAGRRHRREQREAWELAQVAVASIPWLTQLAADGFRAMGEAFGSFGRALTAVGDAIDPPKRSDFALMPLEVPLPVLESEAVELEGPALQHGVLRVESRRIVTGVWSDSRDEMDAARRAQGVEPYDFERDRLGRFRLDGSDL
ncbi:hypothetical protein [Pseudoclavibacter helvolus]|uniref:hypothetical protein n=1 Tax=Pseudoclavibacter helvolus TaxID=255205 RepID=UPI0037370688